MEQLVARRAHNPKVISSSLVPATKNKKGLSARLNPKEILKIHCGVEQLVARRAHNPKVISSSLVPATTKVSIERLEPFFISINSNPNNMDQAEFLGGVLEIS